MPGARPGPLEAELLAAFAACETPASLPAKPATTALMSFESGLTRDAEGVRYQACEPGMVFAIKTLDVIRLDMCVGEEM